MRVDIRKLEKTNKYGYLIWIKYKGREFDCFDENPGKRSVKKVFGDTLKSLGITWAKGIQQAGRTDTGVSADGNILYISTLFNGDMEKLIKDFNGVKCGVIINKIEKTLSDLVLPDLIEQREYLYNYPIEKIEKSKEEIEETCRKYSGEYDVSIFTDNKGIEFKEKIRSVNVVYNDGKFTFIGNSFMPKQIRNMMGYILEDKKKLYPAKYLTLQKVILKKEANDLIFNKYKNDKEVSFEVDELVKKAEKIEKIGDIVVICVSENSKSHLIGKNGINIKKIRKEIGKVVIKDI